jgi:hypothetical protein
MYEYMYMFRTDRREKLFQFSAVRQKAEPEIFLPSFRLLYLCVFFFFFYYTYTVRARRCGELITIT